MEGLATYWKIALEIVILWYAIYSMLLLIKGTRTEQLLKGLLIIGLIFVVTQQMKLEVINWMLTRIFPISVIALVVIFQPELRRGLAQLGQFGIYQEDMMVIDEICEAAISLSRRRIGALIVIQREVGLKTYVESGVPIDAKVMAETIGSIFAPNAPLHDGAVIIERDRIVAAGCLLPLTQEANIAKTLGTRHRAAIGLTEETDAVTIIVSEETGGISVAAGGKLTHNVGEENLKNILKGIFSKAPRRRLGLRLRRRTG